MLYNVAQLLKESVAGSRYYDLSGDLWEIDEQNPGPVRVEGEVTFVRTPRGVLATGTARMKLVHTCTRCLGSARDQVCIEIEEECIPSIDIETGASLPIADDDEADLVIDEHHQIDLREPLRQYAIVAITSGALCRPDCRGLCSACGCDRNVESCDCDVSTIDPRLAVLSQLLETQQDTDQFHRKE